MKDYYECRPTKEVYGLPSPEEYPWCVGIIGSPTCVSWSRDRKEAEDYADYWNRRCAWTEEVARLSSVSKAQCRAEIARGLGEGFGVFGAEYYEREFVALAPEP